MLDTNRLIKTALLTTTIVSIACALFVWAFPVMSVNFINMTMHSRLAVQEPTLTLGRVVATIIMWNIIVGLISWLFCEIYNRVKE